MKKLIPLCLSVLLLVGFTACSGGSEEDRATTATSGSESAAQGSAGAGESNAAVIYFSATGNTEQVAQTLADKTSAALFEIEPEEPYTDADLDYNNDSCRANQEQNDPNARPAIAGDALDLSGYDTIYLGYPIWWGIAAWPVDGFVEANDFTGKAVIPFCTAASSGIGDSGNLLEEMAGTGNWLEGKRLDRGISEDEVKDWISDLGISSVEN